MTDDDINDLIDKAIEQLADDNINVGVEALTELAHVFARAAMPIETFFNIRKYIINEASERTTSFFIAEKIKLAEREARDVRLFTDQGRGKGTDTLNKSKEVH